MDDDDLPPLVAPSAVKLETAVPPVQAKTEPVDDDEDMPALVSASEAATAAGKMAVESVKQQAAADPSAFIAAAPTSSRRRIKKANPFLLFFESKRAVLTAEFPTANFAELTGKANTLWTALSAEEKAPFFTQAQAMDLASGAAFIKPAAAGESKKRARAADDEDDEDIPPPKRARKAPGSGKLLGPRTNYMLWLASVRERYVQENPAASVQEINRLAGQEWKTLSAAERAVWDEAAVADKARYDAAVAADPTLARPPKKSRSKKEGDAGPKPKLTSYVLFSQDTRPQLLASMPGVSFAVLSTLLSTAWKELPAAQREVYEKRAEEDKARYERELKEYNKQQPQEKKTKAAAKPKRSKAGAGSGASAAARSTPVAAAAATPVAAAASAAAAAQDDDDEDMPPLLNPVTMTASAGVGAGSGAGAGAGAGAGGSASKPVTVAASAAQAAPAAAPPSAAVKATAAAASGKLSSPWQALESSTAKLQQTLAASGSSLVQSPAWKILAKPPPEETVMPRMAAALEKQGTASLQTLAWELGVAVSTDREDLVRRIKSALE